MRRLRRLWTILLNELTPDEQLLLLLTWGFAIFVIVEVLCH